MKTKATLFNFDGTPLKTYSIDVEMGTAETSSETGKIGHQIVIADRSGSMWGDMDALKDTIIKLFTLSEFSDSEMLVSLISYSSKGDVTVHFSRTPISEVMAAGSDHLKEIRKIRATYLTCASQAMEIAETLIDDEEITGIVLHSDGYANDPSPSYEAASLDRICAKMSERDVFVNTIAYSDYSDFVLLSKVANSVSGTCVRANSTKEVFEALQESCSVLAEGKSAAVEVNTNGADYTVFMSKDPKKIIGSTNDMIVKGVADSKHGTFRFSEVAGDTCVATEKNARVALYGMARAKIAAGQINDAKIALLSSGNRTLSEKHMRALTPSQLAAMAADIEETLYVSGDAGHDFYSGTPSFGSDSVSVLDLMNAFSQHRDDILVNVRNIKSSYSKRGLKKIAGKREKDGTVTVPPVDVETADVEYVRMGSVDINRDAATINLTISKPATLIDRSTRKAINEVAGVILDDLKDYRKYTVVGDGEVYLKSISVRFSTKKAFDAMVDLGVIADGDFDHSREYTINLDEMPVCGFDAMGTLPKDVFKDVARLNVMGRIVSALSSGQSSEYTADQIAELKEKCLSDSLYINIPMMNEHDDLDEAIRSGIVDTRTTYKITVGSTDILNVSKFKSANAFLDRLYVVVDKNGNPISKPKLVDVFYDNELGFDHKKLSARTKITAADDFQKEIYDELLGLADTRALMEMGTQIGVPELPKLAIGSGLGKDDKVKLVEEVKRSMAAAERKFWATVISPLVFNIGSTGIVPEWVDSDAMTADELTGKYPELALSKDEKEGTFFLYGNTVIAVYAATAHFSTGKSVETNQEVKQSVTA